MTTPIPIPDFCVNSNADGFDEFLKVFNEYFDDFYLGVLNYYGVLNGSPYGSKIVFAKELTPSEAIAILKGNQLTESQPELLPTQEESKEDIIKSSFGETSYKLMGASAKSQIAIAMETYSTQQTAHLQQQLKEAKELLANVLAESEQFGNISVKLTEKIESILTK
mgnify:CR=1 FL=1|tara:strand:- start:35589 stop:36086 length:498 start_codon:yes stop_codon:yes gene_type:complete